MKTATPTNLLLRLALSSLILSGSALILSGCFGSLAKDETASTEDSLGTTEARRNASFVSLSELIREAESNQVAVPSKYGGRFVTFSAKMENVLGTKTFSHVWVVPETTGSNDLFSKRIVLTFGTSQSENQMVGSLKKNEVRTFVCLVSKESGDSNSLLSECSVE